MFPSNNNNLLRIPTTSQKCIKKKTHKKLKTSKNLNYDKEEIKKICFNAHIVKNIQNNILKLKNKKNNNKYLAKLKKETETQEHCIVYRNKRK